MKKFKNFVALILIIVLSVSVCACGNQNNEIKTLTKNFENSCNKLDMNAMLDCIDPDISESVKKLTGLIGMFSDKDTDELLDSFAKVLFSELPENSKGIYPADKSISAPKTYEPEGSIFINSVAVLIISGL